MNHSCRIPTAGRPPYLVGTTVRLTLLTISAMLIALLPAITTAGLASARSAPEGCVPVAIMAFRGSGEDRVANQRYKIQESNGWEGPTLQRLLREYAYSDAYDSTLADVPIVGLSKDDGYPAPAVDIGYEATRLFYSESRIWQGAADGSVAAIAKMGKFQRAQPAQCPTTQWVLVGYSQGAMAARWAFDAMRSRVSSLYLLGDPFQKPNAPGTTGGGRNGNGIMRFNAPGARTEVDRYYDRRPLSAISFCHNNDVICDFGAYGSGEHTNYLSTASEKRTQGRKLAVIVRQAVQDALVPADTGDIEIMFAIDTTGSMGSYIDAAVDAATTIGNQVLAVTPNSRVGLVEYRDHGDSFVARTVVPLSRDVTAFSNGLAALSAAGGGDTPEAVYSGIVEAAAANWRPGTTRAVAVIGDAAAHDPEPVTGYTAATVLEVLQHLGDARARNGRAREPTATLVEGSALLFGLSSDTNLSQQLQTIADGTGGGVYEIGADGSVGDLLEDVVEQTAAAPQVQLNVSPSLTDHDTVISAAGTTVSSLPAVFDFDLDGDGAYETTDAEPVQAVHMEAGEHTVGVRVTDAEGRTGTASTSIVTQVATDVLDPAITPVRGVKVSPRPAIAGRFVRIRVADGTVAHAARLFRPGKPRSLATVTVAGGRRMKMRIPRNLRPGRYKVEIVGDDATRSVRSIRVRQRPA